jgi:hypothetical protein
MTSASPADGRFGLSTPTVTCCEFYAGAPAFYVSATRTSGNQEDGRNATPTSSIADRRRAGPNAPRRHPQRGHVVDVSGGLPEAWRIAPAIVGEERGEVFEVAGVPRAEPRKGPETRLHSYRITRL